MAAITTAALLLVTQLSVFAGDKTSERNNAPQFSELKMSAADRERALAEADKTLRQRLLELSRKFPQLQKTNRSSLDKLLAEPSPAGTLFIAFQWPPATKAGPTMDVPTAERYQISAILRPPSSEPTAAGDLTSYPNWGLIGHFHAEAGDPALEKALTDLLEKTLQELSENLNRASAGPAQPKPQPQEETPQDYTNFANLPDAEKERIVWNLFDRNAFGKPEHKPICRDLLATQGRYCHANASGFTSSAIALAQKQGWAEMRGLIEAIYQRPTNLWLCQSAFEYLRAVDGKPVPEMIVKAADTLRRAGQYQSLVRDAELNEAKRQLQDAADKEAVLAHMIMVACTSRGKGGTERGINAAMDVLKSLDRQTVGTRLAVLQNHLEGSQRDDVARLRDQLDLTAREPWGEAVSGVQASLRAEHPEWWKNEKPSLKLSLRNRGESSPYVARQQEVAEVEFDGEWYYWCGPVSVLSAPLASGARFDDIAVVLDPAFWRSKSKNEPFMPTPGWHALRVSMAVEEKERPGQRAVSNAIKINLIGINEPPPPNANPDGSAASQWSRPSNGLIVTARPSKPKSSVGDNVVVVFTFKNFSDQPIIHLDAEDKTRATFHQFTFTDDSGKEIAFAAPHEVSDQLVRTTIPPGGTIERIVWLNPWKLAGLGHGYTPISNEPRTFRVTAIYHTRIGLDLKDPRVWQGTIAAPPVRIEIEPRAPQRIKSPPLSEDNSPAAVATARDRGAATAAADIAAGKPVIVYYGLPWSQGKPLTDDATGLPVEIIAEAGCIVTECFAAEATAYNKAVREWHARKVSAEK